MTTTIPYNMTNTTSVLETKMQRMTTPPLQNCATTATPTITLSGREARNLAEKQRRDKLNASINELSSMVPHSAEATRRLDKTAVLRFATHGLRLRHVFGKTAFKRKFKEQYQEQPHLTDSILLLLDSFLITVTCSGQIVLISASVEQLLGHCQSDLYGQNIMQITHPDDQAMLRQQLIPNNIETLFCRKEEEDHNNRSHNTLSDEDSSDSTGRDCRSPSPKEKLYLDDIEKRLRADKRSFTVRLARASTRSETNKSYEIVKVDGCFRRSDCTRTSGSYPIVSQLIRRSRTNICMNGAGVGLPDGSGGVTQQIMQHDAIAQAALHGISGNDIVLVGMARVIRKPQLINRYIESQTLEYKTRHLIDGRIVDCDQRISLVAGYMKDEVRNLSPFSFMHQDDVRWVIVALRQMYDCNSNYGESCYRLLSRNGNFIYLQTKGYMDIDKRTNQVHSFVCINTLLSEEEGKRRVQAMKNKFSTIIKAKVPNNSTQDLPASQNPQQLERIVLYLIENLQKRNDATSTVTLTELPKSPINEAKSPATPLALVPPEPESVKNSITQSVNVVNVTAARTLQKIQEHRQQQQHSPSSSSVSEISTLSPANSSLNDAQLTEADDDPDDDVSQLVGDNANTFVPERPSVLQMQVQSTVRAAPSECVTVVTRTVPISTPPSAHNDAAKRLQQEITVLKRLHQESTARANTFNGANATHGECPAKRTIATQHPLTTAAKPISTTPTQLALALNKSNTTVCSPSNGDIHHVLSESLENINCSLKSIDQNARNLLEKSLNTTTPTHIDRALDDILLEHRQQNEILVNIKSEYSNYIRKQQRQNNIQQQQQQQQQQLPQLILNTASIIDADTTAAAAGTLTPAESASVFTQTPVLVTVTPATLKTIKKLKHSL